MAFRIGTVSKSAEQVPRMGISVGAAITPQSSVSEVLYRKNEVDGSKVVQPSSHSVHTLPLVEIVVDSCHKRVAS